MLQRIATHELEGKLRLGHVRGTWWLECTRDALVAEIDDRRERSRAAYPAGRADGDAIGDRVGLRSGLHERCA